MRSLATASLFLMGLVAFAPQATQAAPTNTISIPVSGANGKTAFTGLFNLTSFTFDGTHLLMNGTVTGTATNGKQTQSVLQTVSAPVTLASAAAMATPAATGSCPVLNLDLGPLNLNVLGLVVTTNEIVLNINAVPGPGNLLGNLLCDVAGLLNGGPSAGLANLLNQLLSILRGL